jgi:hypothetical protein
LKGGIVNSGNLQKVYLLCRQKFALVLPITQTFEKCIVVCVMH